MVVSSPSPPSSPAGFLVRPALSSHQPVSSTAFLKALFPLGIRRRRASPSRIVATSASYGYNSPPPSRMTRFIPGCRSSTSRGTLILGDGKIYEDEESVVGDCLVFEEGAFEVGDPLGSLDSDGSGERIEEASASKAHCGSEGRESGAGEVEGDGGGDQHDEEGEACPSLSQFSSTPPVTFPLHPKGGWSSHSFRWEGVTKEPRLAIKDESLDRISNFFNSRDYVPEENDDDKKPGSSSPRRKNSLEQRIPNLADATSSKWLPLHAFAASGEFYLLDALLKHNVDVNAPDKDGATLMHYAVLNASTQIIKILLLYDVDIDLPDEAFFLWVLFSGRLDPLHLAVQTLRTDVVRLLLIKGWMDALDLCLHSGHHLRTFELIKLLKEPTRSKPTG
ncbi:unnamed protein product [Spirodela intermedia]|uniref:Uncharacterized protein n=1 Tax=Spirodela intermedia TaxID=51605 RepID=A0A7I8J940_SPIIN|nr:unnamed protein product [Spirodela intermedia]CAA6666736.1 unnamed protein product [Spirodela intermedia]